MRRLDLDKEAPAVAACCEVEGINVVFVSAHLFPFPENASERAKEVKQILKSRHGRALVFMGDLNVRREEVAPLCEEHGLRAMPCGAATWNARVNKFYEDQKNRKDSQAFDQIWTSGNVWVEGHLACACKEYRAGSRFFLSDHFALLALLDVHASYGAAGGGTSSIADKRREVLGELRTQSAASERLMTEEKEQAGERSLALEADRENQREKAKEMREKVKARKAREEKNRKEREEVFGAGSLFALPTDMRAPQAAGKFDLAALHGVLATQASDIWRDHVGHHPVNGLRVPHLCSYVPATVQLLLRIPAMSMWLKRHSENCNYGANEAERSGRCATCALWASHRNLKEPAREFGRRSFAPLFVNRHLVGKAFVSGGEKIFVDFLCALLQEMRRLEIASSRAVVWPGIAGSALDSCTHVDRLFAHVLEERYFCTECCFIEVGFARSVVLSLPVPASGGEGTCVTDLYTEYCRMWPDGSSEDGLRFCSGQCRSRQEHWVQRRMASSPNVLVVQVPRFTKEGSRRNFVLEAEEELFLPDHEPFELFGGVYFKGRKLVEAESGYTCVCRGPDDQLWEFDGEKIPRRPIQNIVSDRRRSSCVLVYMRRRGSSAFAGSRVPAVAEQASDSCKQQVDSVKAAVGAVAQTVIAKTEAAPPPAKAGAADNRFDVPSEELAAVVARAKWKRCLLCSKTWHGEVEVDEIPNSIALLLFRCRACTVVPEEQEAKRRRLAEEEPETEEKQMGDAPPKLAVAIGQAVESSGDVESKSEKRALGAGAAVGRIVVPVEVAMMEHHAEKRRKQADAKRELDAAERKAQEQVAEADRKRKAAKLEERAQQEGAEAERKRHGAELERRAQQEAVDAALRRKAAEEQVRREAVEEERRRKAAAEQAQREAAEAARLARRPHLVYPSGEEPSEGARLAWQLSFFQSQASRQQPLVADTTFGNANCAFL
jgi:hypothetical protein